MPPKIRAIVSLPGPLWSVVWTAFLVSLPVPLPQPRENSIVSVMAAVLTGQVGPRSEHSALLLGRSGGF